jgi:hypothetical protein
MKISRRRRYTKCVKHTRNTKHGRGKQYNTKRKYRKYSRKLKYKSRLQKGGMLRTPLLSAPEPPSQLAPDLPSQPEPSQFEFPVPDHYTDLVKNTQRNMTVSSDYRIYTFKNTSGEYPVFKSSSEEGARVMNLNFKKSEGSTFRSKDKILNKPFNWRITLKEIKKRIIDDISYMYIYSIELRRRSDKEPRPIITLKTDVYVVITHSSRSVDPFDPSRIFIGNGTEHSTGSSTGTQRKIIPNLSQGLTLKVNDSVDNETYTFPYGDDSDTNNFYNISLKLSDLRSIGDLMVLKKLYTSLNSIDVKTDKQEADMVAQTIVNFNKVNTINFKTRNDCGIPASFDNVQAVIDNKVFNTSHE